MSLKNHKRITKAARQSPDDMTRLIRVQENQIEALQAQMQVADAVLLAVAELYVYDHIDPETGEVTKGWQK